MRLCLLLVVIVGGFSCGYKRVALRTSLPDASAPLETRLKAYRQNAIQNGQQTTYLKNGVPQSTNLDFVLLGDGTRVEDPRDLAANVSPDSATGKYLSTLEAGMARSKTVALILTVTSLALIGLGLGVGLPVMWSQSCKAVPDRFSGTRTECTRPGDAAGATLIGVGSGLGLIGLNIAMLEGVSASDGKSEDRVSAFMTYNQSLAQRLALDPDSVEDDQRTTRSRPPPSAFLIPAASAWLASLR